MFARRTYYQFKPFLPWKVRLFLRRFWIQHKRKQCEAVWPISQNARRAPADWQGWPGGKKFGVVLTHDVESGEGLNRCRELMDLEASFGFKSSFNFIPEGGYRVPVKLRDELTSRGFEVGVHDFKHDGQLYRNHRKFCQSARHINRYLDEWQAVGFRSGFMLHNLEWLHALNIEYDASTFDTDPFEPQPDGVDTIFPFWVPACASEPDNACPASGAGQPASSPLPSSTVPASSDGLGYVELPYTLPQDFSLFIVMREPTIAIWKQKLDWIADHGGMALLDVHPDYVSINGSPAKPWTYPAKHYRDLLHYVRERHGGTFWHGLPREAAALVRTKDE